MCLSPVQNAIVSSTKMVHLQFIFYLEVGLETLQTKESREKLSLQNFISSREGPEKVQQQGRGERTQKVYLTSVVYFLQMYSVG